MALGAKANAYLGEVTRSKWFIMFLLSVFWMDTVCIYSYVNVFCSIDFFFYEGNQEAREVTRSLLLIFISRLSER